MSEKYVRKSYSISPIAAKSIQEMAAEEGISMSAIVRRLIAKGVDEWRYSKKIDKGFENWGRDGATDQRVIDMTQDEWEAWKDEEKKEFKRSQRVSIKSDDLIQELLEQNKDWFKIITGTHVLHFHPMGEE